MPPAGIEDVSMTLRLPDVTLCMVDCATTTLAARALRKCIGECEFGDAILFCDAPPDTRDFRCVAIARLGSRADYSTFILKELARFITTDYVLVAQWDGYVVEPRAWTDEFLRWDYIGARWHWHSDGMTVGNGGFSLRSRRLLAATAAPDFPLERHVNEDEQICRTQRPFLAAAGIRFAPEPVADRFSYERSVPERPTFGFHGLFNLWRHLEERELIAVCEELPSHVVRSPEFVELLLHQVSMRKFPVVGALCRHWRRACPAPEIHARLLEAMRNPEHVERVERLLDLAVDPAR
jgi:hypothetical protein